MNTASRQALLSAVRSLLIVFGTMLTAKGVTTEASVNETVGAVMVIIPVIWGIWDKYQAEHSAKARETVAVQAGAIAALSGAPVAESASKAEAQTIIKTFGPTP